MDLTQEQSAQVFTEWDRRYRENPEWFEDVAVHLLKSTAEEYGPRAAAYYEAIARELFPQD